MSHFATDYQEFIDLSRYARWRDDLKRREFWPETVDRWEKFFVSHLSSNYKEAFQQAAAVEKIQNILGLGTRYEGPLAIQQIVRHLADRILILDVMPSMRSLMTAGRALERDHMAGYNCAYVHIDDPISFSEIMYILMCGSGVGFSVERQFIAKLPEVAEEFHDTDTVIDVSDSRIGWASSFRQLVALLYSGAIPRWNTERVRKKGERLKTFGGRASGPEPLEDLFRFSVKLFRDAAGRRLTSVECHDLVCKVADVVVSGGVRRSALISLSNVSDDRMRNAKNGAWFEHSRHRSLANNSAAYTEKPDFEVFLKEFVTLYESKSGERGIFSRVAAKSKTKAGGRRDPDHEFGTNPCGEIVLRSMGLCNLSEVVLRPTDTFEEVKKKVRIAAVIGTLQSTLTKFRFVRKQWQKNAEEERLLGVSLTGIMDHPILSGRAVVGDIYSHLDWPHWTAALQKLRDVAVETNAIVADALGINRSVAVTTVKPSGTVSQLVNSSSGIHPRYAPYYIRRVVQDTKDPVTAFLIDSGVPHQKSVYSDDMTVFEFPMKSPNGSLCRNDVSALEQLSVYEGYRDFWCEHNPSTTIYYTDNEFMNVGGWIWNNFDRVGGVSFLPSDDHAYQQAPFEEITEEKYNELKSNFPKIDWDRLKDFEKEDNTVASHEFACAGGVCEL